MSFQYRAVLNVDWAGGAGNEGEALKNALIQAGWQWVETSSYVVETSDLKLIWQGIGLVARQQGAIGDLSALTLHVDGAKDFKGKTPASAANHRDALKAILAKPFPS